MKMLPIALLLLPCTILAQSLDVVLDNYLNKTGGIAAWNNVISSKQQVDVWQNLDFINVRSGTTSVIDGRDPSTQYVIKKLPDFSFTRIPNKGMKPSEFYQNDKKSGFLAYGITFVESPIENRCISIDVAINLIELRKLKALDYLGDEKVDTTTYYVIKGPFCPGSTQIIKFYFHKISKLLAFTKDDSFGYSRIERYSDYRPVKDLIVAFRIETTAGGILFFRQITKSIEFNPPIDNSIFYYHPEETNKAIGQRDDIKIISSPDNDLTSIIKSSFSGRRVFIDLWATWCAPCKIEFQHYNDDYYKFMSNHQIDLVYISIDKAKDVETWKNQTQTLALRGSHLIATKALLQSIKTQVYENGNIQIPRYVLVNEAGEIVSKDFLRPSNESFMSTISKYFRTDR